MDQPLCFIETNVGHGYAAEAGDVANNWHTFRGKGLATTVVGVAVRTDRCFIIVSAWIMYCSKHACSL